ncbi:MAG: phage head morphogenesis protein, partial [Clostridia bacterium]|nr:phage head morphogenesis protein [Clostridia bacterium]
MNNKQYWSERMSILTDAEINKGAEFYAKLQRKYNLAISQMKKEISAWYTRYANENGITYADAQRMLSGKELQRFKMSLEEFIEKAKSG